MKKIMLAAIFVLISSNVCAFSATGFANPYGVAIDPKTGSIYVSNVNGDYNDKDGNGFISKLKPDGTVEELKFFDGASKAFELDAPTGMAVVRSALYVTDINKLHVFDLDARKLYVDINFGDLPVKHLYDIVLGPDDMLYVTDGPGNTIYKIDIRKQHEVTVFAQSEVLGEPHGITWFPAKQALVAAGGVSGRVISWDKEGKQIAQPEILLKSLEGVAADDKGSFYVASTTLGGVFKIAPDFAMTAFALGQGQASGIAFAGQTSELIISSFDTGTISSFPVKN